jgi:hypothetical protein
LRRYTVATASAADATAANTAEPMKSVAATDADVTLVAAAAKRAIVVSDAVAAACAAATAADEAHVPQPLPPSSGRAVQICRLPLSNSRLKRLELSA